MLDTSEPPVQWYFRTEGSPVFIRIHFLPDALQDLKQSPISFPSQLDFVLDIEDPDELEYERCPLGGDVPPLDDAL